MSTLWLAKKRASNLRGFTFIEVMVSLVVLAIGLVGLAGLTNVIIFHNMFASDYHAATRLAYDKINELLRYDSESDIAGDTAKYCSTTSARCTAIAQGWMLATGPTVYADTTVNLTQAQLAAIDDDGFTLFDDTGTTCIGLPNEDKLEAAKNSDEYCSRMEYELNADGNFKRATEGGYGANALARLAPYKYNRFYITCRCVDGVQTASSHANCATPCAAFPSVKDNEVTFVARVYVYWRDQRGKFHYVATPYQGITMEVDDLDVWDD